MKKSVFKLCDAGSLARADPHSHHRRSILEVEETSQGSQMQLYTFGANALYSRNTMPGFLAGNLLLFYLFGPIKMARLDRGLGVTPNFVRPAALSFVNLGWTIEGSPIW